MTGLEALQKIINDVQALKTSIDEMNTAIKLIEVNIKMLNNRAAGLLKQGTETTLSPEKYKSNEQIKLDNTWEKPPQIEKNDKVLVYKKVFGKLLDNNKEPIEGVLVRIYDKNNEVCATSETDPTGYWTSMIRPGKYIAEFVKTGFRQINKSFELSKNMKELEVI